jgi:Domain of unknown function (DUF4333)
MNIGHALVRGRTSVLTLITLMFLGTVLPSCTETSSTSTSPSSETTSSASVASSAASSAAPSADTSKNEMTQKIEAALISTLASQVPSPITKANCPNIDKLEAGKKFDCETTIAEGTFSTTVTIKDTEGNIRFIPNNLVAVATLEKTFVDAIKTKDKVDAKVTCGSGKVIILKTVGEKLECTLTQSTGKAGTATATVLDLSGKVKTDWKLDK